MFLDAMHMFGSSASKTLQCIVPFFPFWCDFLEDTLLTFGPILDKSLGSKEVAKGNLTPETKKPVSADSIKVEISASKLKMEASLWL